MAVALIQRGLRLGSLTALAYLVAAPFTLGSDQTESDVLASEETKYRHVITERARRIVDALHLTDEAQHDRVVTLVARQYRSLRDIHDRRDQAIELLSDGPAAVAEPQIEKQRLEAERAVLGAHRKFVARLAAELPPESVEQIKDGMTYGVAQITYQAYLSLLPNLSEEDKREIKACLLEAREYAMDGGSSDEKHAWFGKYKGRINNYLSAKGYDLKQAERVLADRRKGNEGQ
jgi:hypothetical protein